MAGKGWVCAKDMKGVVVGRKLCRCLGHRLSGKHQDPEAESAYSFGGTAANS